MQKMKDGLGSERSAWRCLFFFCACTVKFLYTLRKKHDMMSSVKVREIGRQTKRVFPGKKEWICISLRRWIISYWVHRLKMS